MVERNGGSDTGGQEAIYQAVVESNAVFIWRPFSSREDTGHGNGKPIVLETHALRRNRKRRQSRGGHAHPKFDRDILVDYIAGLNKVCKSLHSWAYFAASTTRCTLVVRNAAVGAKPASIHGRLWVVIMGYTGKECETARSPWEATIRDYRVHTAWNVLPLLYTNTRLP